MITEKMVVSTKTSLSVIENDSSLSVAKAQKYLAKYEKAATGYLTGAWNLAKVVCETINATDFSEAFGTLDNYAMCIGVSKATVSKYSRAYELLKVLVEAKPDIFANITAGQVQEMLPIAKSGIVDFVEKNNITADTSLREIRRMVNIYKNGEEPEDVDGEEPEEVDGEVLRDSDGHPAYFTISNSDGASIYVNDKEKAISILNAICSTLGRPLPFAICGLVFDNDRLIYIDSDDVKEGEE